MHHDERIEAFYSSRAWRKCREMVLAEHGGLCQICFSRHLIEPAVDVHHIIHITPENVDDPAVTLNEKNLMALCERCHKEQHRQKRWRCDAFGRVTL